MRPGSVHESTSARPASALVVSIAAGVDSMRACPSPQRRRPWRSTGVLTLRSLAATVATLLLVGKASAFLFAGRQSRVGVSQGSGPSSSSSSSSRCAGGFATSSSWLQDVRPPLGRRAALSAAATTGDEASHMPTARFDKEKAIKLAAYSFAAYGDPT